jgi:hypothetical protein
MWVVPLPLSLRQADIFKAQDIPHSRPFMDSQRTTFSVRASTLLLSNSPEKGLEFNVVLANGSFVTVNSASHPDCRISSLYSVMFLTSSFLQCSGLCVGVVLEAGALL